MINSEIHVEYACGSPTQKTMECSTSFLSHEEVSSLEAILVHSIQEPKSNLPMLSVNSSTSRRGKPLSQLSRISKEFFGNASALKKDNLRTRVLRSLKKMIRVLQRWYAKQRGRVHSSLLPKELTQASSTSLLSATVGTPMQEAAWQSLVNVFTRHRQNLCTSRKRIQNPISPSSVAALRVYEIRGYSDAHCRLVFSDPGMREMYIAFLDLLFADRSCYELSKIFHIPQGCLSCQDVECETRWQQLREVLVDFLTIS